MSDAPDQSGEYDSLDEYEALEATVARLTQERDKAQVAVEAFIRRLDLEIERCHKAEATVASLTSENTALKASAVSWMDSEPGWPCGCGHDVDKDGVPVVFYDRCRRHRELETLLESRSMEIVKVTEDNIQLERKVAQLPEAEMSQCRYCSKWGPCPEHEAKYPVAPPSQAQEIARLCPECGDDTADEWACHRCLQVYLKERGAALRQALRGIVQEMRRHARDISAMADEGNINAHAAAQSMLKWADAIEAALEGK